MAKGRLVAAGLVTPVNDTSADHDRQGMITKEMLDEYKCNSLLLTKPTAKSTKMATPLTYGSCHSKKDRRMNKNELLENLSKNNN